MPEELSTEAELAIHKTRSAQQAVEIAREVQIQKAIEETANRTENSIRKVLQEVFVESDSEKPEKMKVLWSKIPLLCTNMTAMHESIRTIEANQTNNTKAIEKIESYISKGVWVILTAVLVGLLNLIIPH